MKTDTPIRDIQTEVIEKISHAANGIDGCVEILNLAEGLPDDFAFEPVTIGGLKYAIQGLADHIDQLCEDLLASQKLS